LHHVSVFAYCKMSFSLPILLAGYYSPRSFAALDWENWDFFQYKTLYENTHIHIRAGTSIHICLLGFLPSGTNHFSEIMAWLFYFLTNYHIVHIIDA
jgi:ABC-type spermidine/putrescine transport system permease subunit II